MKQSALLFIIVIIIIGILKTIMNEINRNDQDEK